MHPPRVLLVEPSLPYRRVLREALTAFCECEVDDTSDPEHGFDLALRRGRNEEPGRESAQRASLGHHVGGRWRLPVRPSDEVIRKNLQADLFLGFSNRCLLGGRKLIGPLFVRIDSSAGEHPHPAERDLRIASQHQHLEPSVGVPNQHDGGGGNQFFSVGHPMTLLDDLRSPRARRV